MPKPATGHVERRDGTWKVQVTMPRQPGEARGRRVWIALEPTLTEVQALAEGAALSALARRPGTMLRTEATAPAAGESVEAWSTRWLAAREARGLRSVRDDRGRLRTHVWPAIGSRPMASITRDDVEDLVAGVDRRVRAATLSWKTAANVWALTRAMFRDAVRSKDRSLRVRRDNPCTDVAPPDRGVRKVKCWLYPSEVRALLADEGTGLHWRRIFALAVYTYVRIGELEALQWSDVDLAHGTIHVHRATDALTGDVRETKGRASRRIPIEPNLRPLLEAMRREAGGTGLVVPHMPSRELGAPTLRAALKRAGVDRDDLYENDATRKHITAHDLRATGVTWAILRGDEPAHVQGRAGHTSYSTTEGYVREAAIVGAVVGEVFPAMPASLLGEPAAVPNATANATGEAPTMRTSPANSQGEKWRPLRDSNPR